MKVALGPEAGEALPMRPEFLRGIGSSSSAEDDASTGGRDCARAVAHSADHPAHPGRVLGEAPEPRTTRTVVVVDGQPVSRMGLERVLTSWAGLLHLASFKEARQLRLLSQKPDVVVAAVAMSDDVTTALEAFDVAHTVVAVLGEACDFPEVMAAIRSGVGGVVTKATEPSELLFAVDAVARGGCYLSSELTARIRGGRIQQASNRPALTPRELETASWLVKGLTHRQIARRMGLTEETVNTYVKRLRSKLSVGNKAALTRKVIECGYLTGNQTP